MTSTLRAFLGLARRRLPNRRENNRFYKPHVECLERLVLPAGGVVTMGGPILYVDAADANAALQNGTQAHPYGTIQAAVNNAVSGDTIEVAAGTYAENVVIMTGSLTIAGPNAGVNPTTAMRGPEAIVEPGLASSFNTSSIFTVEADNVTIEGFTIQGSIGSASKSQSAGFTLANGVTVYAAAGVSNSTDVSMAGTAGATVDVSGMVVQNNILQYFTQFGIEGDTSDGTASVGNSFNDNRIRGLPENGQSGYYGQAIQIYDNFYANINDNGLSEVRTGIQTGNNYASAGAFSPSINGNYVNADVKGIYYNLQYQDATSFTISQNVITLENGTISPAYNVGLLIQSIQDSVSSVILNNNISGFLYGVEFAGNDTTNTVTLTGGTLSDNTYGIWDTNNDYFYPAPYDTTAAVGRVNITNSLVAGIWIDSTSANSAGMTDTTDTTSLAFNGGTLIAGGPTGLLVDGSLSLVTGDTLGATTFRGQSGNYITLANGALAGATLDATGASFDVGPGGTQVTGAQVTAAQGFAVVNKITDAVSNPSLGFVRIKPNNVFVTTKTGSIQNGIEAASTGDTVNVAPGIYVANGNIADAAAGVVYELNVDKSVTLLGPNATYNPLLGGVPTNQAAIIEPGTSDPNPNDSTAIVIVGVSASNVTIAGFTINGDNPALAHDANTITYNGVPIDASEGIASYTDVSNITITNNVVQNTAYAGIDFENGVNSGAATADNLITYNLLSNLGGGGFGYGIGVVIYDNFYADVTDNVMNTVRVGVQTGNFSQANPDASFTPQISFNRIAAVRRGIFYNLHYQDASPFTISFNTINAVADPTITQWDGILIASQQDDVSATFLNNAINGSASQAATVAGYDVWNTPTTGTILIEGGSVAGVDYGVWVNTYEGYNSNADNTQATIDGLTGIARQIGIYVEASPQNTINSTASADISGSIFRHATSFGPIVETANSGVGVDISGSTASAVVADTTLIGDLVGIRVENDGTLSSATSNAILNNLTGVQVTSGTATLSANRIVGNNVGVSSIGASSTVTADDNWWGTNGGPNAVGSDRATAVEGGALDDSTWLVLSVSAASTALQEGQATMITADLTHDNTGAAVTPTLPPTPVTFAATTGQISPHVSTLLAGTATATFTAGPADSIVSATVDNQKAIAYVDVYPMVTAIILGTTSGGQSEFVVAFSQDVTLTPGAITLTDVSSGATPTLHIVTYNGGHGYVVTVTGDGTTNGALNPGQWMMTVHAADVFDADGLSPQMDVSKTFKVS